MNDARRLLAAGRAIRLLWAAPLDPVDAAQRLAFEAAAATVIEAVIATPAAGAEGFAVKAEAVAWCCGSRADFALGDTPAERVIGSLLDDLLRAA
jgi:hypothetical protein